MWRGSLNFFGGRFCAVHTEAGLVSCLRFGNPHFARGLPNCGRPPPVRGNTEVLQVAWQKGTEAQNGNARTERQYTWHKNKKNNAGKQGERRADTRARRLCVASLPRRAACALLGQQAAGRRRQRARRRPAVLLAALVAERGGRRRVGAARGLEARDDPVGYSLVVKPPNPDQTHHL